VRYYVRAEIERFLRAVDKALKRRATIIVIGGGAAALEYRIDDPTTDIDTFNALGADLRRAIETAREATGLPMPFEQSGAADRPYDFEDRLLRALPSLMRLTVFVPERHDLAPMKTLRGDQADFAKLQAIHERTPFDLSVLLQRYVAGDAEDRVLEDAGPSRLEHHRAPGGRSRADPRTPGTAWREHGSQRRRPRRGSRTVGSGTRIFSMRRRVNSSTTVPVMSSSCSASTVRRTSAQSPRVANAATRMLVSKKTLTTPA
jgi:hypothetical protein